MLRWLFDLLWPQSHPPFLLQLQHGYPGLRHASSQLLLRIYHLSGCVSLHMTGWALDTILQPFASSLDLTPWPLSTHHPQSQKLLEEKIQLALSEKGWQQSSSYGEWQKNPLRGQNQERWHIHPGTHVFWWWKCILCQGCWPTFCNYQITPDNWLTERSY